MPSFLITSLCGDTSAGAAFSQMRLQRSDDGQLSHQNGQLLFWQKFSAITSTLEVSSSANLCFEPVTTRGSRYCLHGDSLRAWADLFLRNCAEDRVQQDERKPAGYHRLLHDEPHHQRHALQGIRGNK